MSYSFFIRFNVDEDFSIPIHFTSLKGHTIGFQISNLDVQKAILQRDNRLFDLLIQLIEKEDEIFAESEFYDFLYQDNDLEYYLLADKVVKSPYSSKQAKSDAENQIEWLKNKYYPPEKTLSIPKRIHGYVYVLKADNNLYKIGRAKQLDKRILQLSVQLPYDLVLVASIESDDYANLEKELHNTFTNKRKRGEWFDLDEDDIARIKAWDGQP